MQQRGGSDDAGRVVLDVGTGLDAVVALLTSRRHELDELNVFPVPDADTGANVVATLRVARDAAAGPPAAAGSRAAEAAVRGARGNSGIMLAQVLRALLDVEHDLVDARLADRLERADRLARAAVATPVDGSLLSAAGAAAVAARAAAGRTGSGSSGIAQLEAATTAAHDDVATSPTRNEVLAHAGVVDAGGRALALVLEALAAAATGRAPSPPGVVIPADRPHEHAAVGGGRYEVMYLVEEAGLVGTEQGGTPRTPSAAALVLRDRLGAVGDSVVVVPGADVVSAHVHTDDVGAAIAAGIAIGSPSALRVEDLHAQAGVHAAPTGAAVSPTLLVGAAAPGLRALVESVGATVLRLGGGRDDVDAAAVLGATAARGPVLLLPGGEDALAGARRAATAVAAIGGHAIEVVAGAVGPAQVVTALAVLDPRAPSPAALQDAIDATATAAVPGPPDAAALLAAVEDLAATQDEPVELVTVLLGPTADAADADEVRRALADALPALEVEVLLGAAADHAHVVVE